MHVSGTFNVKLMVYQCRTSLSALLTVKNIVGMAGERGRGIGIR